MNKRKTCSSIKRNVYFDEGAFRWSTLAGMCQQIIQVSTKKPRRILEIGKGNGFISEFLTNAGFKVTTFDINRKLKPDVIGSILELDKHFSPGQFDCVLCAEVLEHLPFKQFDDCLKMISYVACRDVIITLPRLQKILFDCQMRISIPGIKPIELGVFLSIPQKKHKIYREHFWEINSEQSTRLKNIRSILSRHLVIQRDFRERWRPYHHFFILQKSN